MKKDELKKIIRECLKEVAGDEFNPDELPKGPDWKKTKFVKHGTPEYAELMKQMQQGKAKRMHLYDIRNILRPRGPMRKESLSLEIYRVLREAFEYWSRPEYGDSVTAEKLVPLLKHNLEQEVAIAWKRFSEGPPTEHGD
jgi:hypothetical protein